MASSLFTFSPSMLALAFGLGIAACSSEEPETQLVEQTQRSIAVTAALEDSPEAWQYPQTRQMGDYKAVIHAPQIRSWPDFRRFEGIVALEFYPDGESSPPLFATATISGATELQLEERLVVVTEPSVGAVQFATAGKAEYVVAIQSSVRSNRLEMPLDIFLASLAEEVLGSNAPEGFSTEPPQIVVAYSPTILLHVPGQPFLEPLEQTGLQVVVNANWPLLFDPDKDLWYLLYRDLWLTSASLEGSWSVTTNLPATLGGLSGDGEHEALLAAVPPPHSDAQAPLVLFSAEPTELIVIEGEPSLEAVEDDNDLRYVSNTSAALLQYQETWYFLVAGRWFATTDLDDGPWRWQAELPMVFRDIPADHQLAYVRAAVAGTPEARLAALEARLPHSQTLRRDAGPGIDVVYDGEPQFETVDQSTVQRAINSPYDVLLVDGSYYLCYQGAWFRSADPGGPWTVADEIPVAIYDIPPSSPSYPVTDVTVASSSADSVSYAYTPAYSTGTYVYYGVPVYSTGWYYRPYYGSIYIPYYPSYGYARYYDPDTGAYGQRSTWYGPYGGYSYGEGYNPTTGRYGYRETAWDGDEWASYSEITNPRTGIETRTERYYDDDRERAEMERTIEGQNASLDTKRTTDFDNQWSETQRESSRGGSSEIRREWNEDGNLDSSGTVEAADGRTATISGSYEDGEGSTTIKGSEGGEGTITRSTDGDGITREGEFTTRDGETISSSSERQGRDSYTEIESSSGAQIKSVSEGGSRLTIGESAGGDVYAGHNGEVYKKTDDGWQQYDPNSRDWQQAESRQQAGEQAQARPSSQGQDGAATQAQARHKTSEGSEASATTRTQRQPARDMSQLDRDARARTQGYDRFQRRRSTTGRAAGRRGGLGGRRR